MVTKLYSPALVNHGNSTLFQRKMSIGDGKLVNLNEEKSIQEKQGNIQGYAILKPLFKMKFSNAARLKKPRIFL